MHFFSANPLQISNQESFSLGISKSTENFRKFQILVGFTNSVAMVQLDWYDLIKKLSIIPSNSPTFAPIKNPTKIPTAYKQALDIVLYNV